VVIHKRYLFFCRCFFAVAFLLFNQLD